MSRKFTKTGVYRPHVHRAYVHDGQSPPHLNSDPDPSTLNRLSVEPRLLLRRAALSKTVDLHKSQRLCYATERVWQ